MGCNSESDLYVSFQTSFLSWLTSSTAIIIVIVVAAIALSSYSTASAKAALPPPKQPMKDSAVGTDEGLMEDDIDVVSTTDGELERLLRDSGLEAKGKPKMVDHGSGPGSGKARIQKRGKGADLDVDRI